jgi:large subunit ribosomal protein L13
VVSKALTFSDMMTKDPRKVLQLAVKGMLPRGPLGRKMLAKLKLFTDEQHEHAAQLPEPLQFKNIAVEKVK